MERRIVIAGSRDFNDYECFCEHVDRDISKIRNEYKLIILSGHCKGTDLLGERYAAENGFEVELYPADWKQYGRFAGPKRNKLMVDVADYAIAFPSGGNGTKSLIDYAQAKGIPTKVHNIANKI